MLKKLIKNILDILYPLLSKFMPFDFYAYLMVGGANTAFNIFVYVMCYEFILSKTGYMLFGFQVESYTISLVLAFFTTIPTGFWLAKHFAFKQSKRERGKIKQMIKYFFVVTQGLAIDYLLLIMLILGAGFHPTIAKITTTILVVLITFLLQKYFTFRVSVT